jgi:signal transduction histidine kinase
MFGASMSVQDVHTMLYYTVLRSVAMSAGVFVLATLLTFLVAHTLAKPITELTQVARQVADGHLDQEIEVGGTQEIESLSESLRMMTRSLREQIAELKMRNAELQRFTYTASHDLKSPLTTIKGFLGALRRDLAQDRKGRVEHDIERIGAATDRLFVFIDDLLELSRIGRIIHPPEDVFMAVLVEETLESMRAALDDAGIEVRVESPLPMLYGDRVRLGQVLQNLIDNALKYTKDREDGHIVIGSREADGETICFVSDNGIGIDPRYHERVFDLFEKLTPGTGGSGVGLALCKRIVEVHGGRTWIESDGEGKGTTVCFTLPPRRNAPGRAGEEAPPLA